MNRLNRERAVTTIALASVMVASGTAVWWALQPVPPLVIENAPELHSAEGQLIAAQPLNASVFDIELWPEPVQAATAQATPTTVTTPSPPPPPPAPINLSLIAIVETDTGWQVALYDPSQQRIVLAGEGDVVGAVRVREVTATTVLLELAGRTRQLALEGGTP
ncbi:MAG: hypothetical protein NCW75_05210 [Phycisphaera sp.]|nr:MAG: hypothetical protein NCW75_05210 [Phycisphaera sp.]